MNRSFGRALALCLLCAGCATARPPGSAPMAADSANGQALATVVATPFRALFKAAGCVVTAIVVAPSAAALALTDRSSREREQAALYEGLGQNCYGSYALAPI
jgi:hypothetical protein